MAHFLKYFHAYGVKTSHFRNVPWYGRFWNI